MYIILDMRKHKNLQLHVFNISNELTSLAVLVWNDCDLFEEDIKGIQGISLDSKQCRVSPH